MDAPRATFYVQVPSIVDTLDKAATMGAQTVMPSTDIGMIVMAQFRDPEGNIIGLIEGLISIERSSRRSTSTRASLKQAPPPRSVSVSGHSALAVAPLSVWRLHNPLGNIATPPRRSALSWRGRGPRPAC